MEYKLIQQKDTNLKKFNDEINRHLADGWTLHGDYRITVIEASGHGPGYIVNTQLLERDDSKVKMGFGFSAKQ